MFVKLVSYTLQRYNMNNFLILLFATLEHVGCMCLGIDKEKHNVRQSVNYSEQVVRAPASGA